MHNLCHSAARQNVYNFSYTQIVTYTEMVDEYFKKLNNGKKLPDYLGALALTLLRKNFSGECTDENVTGLIQYLTELEKRLFNKFGIGKSNKVLFHDSWLAEVELVKKLEQKIDTGNGREFKLSPISIYEVVFYGNK